MACMVKDKSAGLSRTFGRSICFCALCHPQNPARRATVGMFPKSEVSCASMLKLHIPPHRIFINAVLPSGLFVWVLHLVYDDDERINRGSVAG